METEAWGGQPFRGEWGQSGGGSVDPWAAGQGSFPPRFPGRGIQASLLRR